MKRLALTLAAALVLGACSSAPSLQAAQASAPLRIEAVGTLATNACEAAVAADYTATEVMVRQAAARLRDGSLAIADAQRVADAARTARTELGAACAASKTAPDQQAMARARAARAAMARAMTAGEPR